MPIQEFFHLTWIDVLATADDHVLGASDDAAVAFRVDGCKVTAVHPAGGIDRLASPLLVVPISPHDTVAARQ
jgi:hypothetical protein